MHWRGGAPQADATGGQVHPVVTEMRLPLSHLLTNQPVTGQTHANSYSKAKQSQTGELGDALLMYVMQSDFEAGRMK